MLLAPQLIPAGLLVALPLPASASARVGGPIKLPRASGLAPTGIVPTTVLLAVAITERLFELAFAT